MGHIAAGVLGAFIITIGCSGASLFSSNGTRIVGGIPAERGEFKWIVWIQARSGSTGFMCGGLIVNLDSILTAAHCCDRPAVEYTVYAGDHIRNVNEGSEQSRTVRSVIPHPQYNDDTVDNDVCILKLTTPFTTGEYVGAATLATAGGIPSGNLVVAGWGDTTDGGSDSQTLLKVTVPFVSDARCKDLHGTGNILPGNICAGEGGKDFCDGDSGGPLHQELTVVGVVSWSDCGNPREPGVYASVAYYRAWINQNSQDLD